MVTSRNIYISGSDEYHVNEVILFNREGELIWSPEMDEDRDVWFRMFDDGSSIATGFDDNSVRRFDQNGNLLWSYTADSKLGGISISADGSYIAAQSENEEVYLLNREGDFLWSYGLDNEIRELQISPDDSYIIVSSGDISPPRYGYKTLSLFDQTGELLWSYEPGYGFADVFLSPDGSYIAVESYSHVDESLAHEISLFNYKGELLWKYEIEEGEHIRDIAVSPDSSFIAVGSGWGGTVYFLNREGRLLWSHDTASAVQGISFSPGGYYIVAHCWDGEVYFFVYPPALQNSLGEVENLIILEEAKGFNVAKAERLLTQAKEAFEARDYQISRKLKLEAGQLALDIDEDGVPNIDDFAPGVNNRYIYLGGSVCLAI